LQALGNLGKMDYAVASIELCWGPMLTLGKGCFWELFSPEWTRFMEDGDKVRGLFVCLFRVSCFVFRVSYCYYFLTFWLRFCLASFLSTKLVVLQGLAVGYFPCGNQAGDYRSIEFLRNTILLGLHLRRMSAREW
jgi:hypothetical protein